MTTSQPHKAKIREELNIAFDDAQLSAFCFDYFQEVYDKFSEGMRKDYKIQLLMEHCDAKNFKTLLNSVRQESKISDNSPREELKPLIIVLEAYAPPLIEDVPHEEGHPSIIPSIFPKLKIPIMISLLVLIAGLAYFWRGNTYQKMQKEFNVAVSEFIIVDESGNVVKDDDGIKLAKWLFGHLESSFEEIDLGRTYELWPPDDTGRVIGKTPEEREEHVQELAERINANIIIYGLITKHNKWPELHLEFYIHPNDFEEAVEITGKHALGRPLAIELPFDSTHYQMIEDPPISDRVQALSLITIGLGFYSYDNFEKALKYFEQAEEIKGWWKEAGKEIIYLLLGNTYVRQAGIKKSSENLDIAYEYYQDALEINDNYARAEVGQAGVKYLTALGDPNNEDFNDVDLEKLEESEEAYQRVLTFNNSLKNINITAKVHLSLGQIYMAKSQITDKNFLLPAKENLNTVIKLYKNENISMANSAAHAYARLGHIAWLEKDLKKAAQYYKDARELVTPYYKGLYSIHLGDIYLEMNEPDLAIEAYEYAVNKAEYHGDEASNTKYKNKLNELKNRK